MSDVSSQLTKTEANSAAIFIQSNTGKLQSVSKIDDDQLSSGELDNETP